MNLTQNNTNIQKSRISEIDAMRAFALLGICIVHFWNSYGLKTGITNSISIDKYINSLIAILLPGRFADIFAVMFGISFFIILSKPNYSREKFVWRSMILMISGLAVKRIYTYDALFWYGLIGCILPIFYNCRKTVILLLVIFFLAITSILDVQDLGVKLLPSVSSVRSDPDIPILEYISYPHSLRDYLRSIISSGIFGTLYLFLLGFYLGKIGIIYRLRDYSKNGSVLKWGVIYSVLLFLNYLLNHITSDAFFVDIIISFIYKIMLLSGAIFYSIIFLKLYFSSGFRFLTFFESYGKLGLTNYVLQHIIGVFILYSFGAGLSGILLSYKILIAFVVFSLQLACSFYWLKVYKYGPLEWFWRSLTNLRIVPFKIQNTS